MNYLERNSYLKITRIPTGQTQTSWLSVSMAEELNLDYRETTPACGQGRIWTRVTELKSSALNHSAMLPSVVLWVPFQSPAVYSRDGAVVRALASTNVARVWFLVPASYSVCGLSLLLVLVLAPGGFFSGYSSFPLPSKTNVSKFQFHIGGVPSL